MIDVLRDWWWNLASPYPPSAPTGSYNPAQPAPALSHHLASTGTDAAAWLTLGVALILLGAAVWLLADVRHRRACRREAALDAEWDAAEAVRVWAAGVQFRKETP